MNRTSTIIADSSILIHLSKIGQFHLLKKIYGEITIARSVYTEVVEKGWGLAGSLEAEDAIQDGWIKTLDITGKWKAREMATAHGIHLANAETVQLAHESEAVLILADEGEVRELAQKSGMRVRGCLGVLVEAAKREIIGVDEAREDAEKLMEEGYRVSEEVLREFHDLLSEER